MIELRWYVVRNSDSGADCFKELQYRLSDDSGHSWTEWKGIPKHIIYL